jgi:hypothetical protein
VSFFETFRFVPTDVHLTVKQLANDHLIETYAWDNVEGKRADTSLVFRVDDPVPLTGDVRIEAFNKALMVKKVRRASCLEGLSLFGCRNCAERSTYVYT